jgi:hypothetical protein
MTDPLDAHFGALRALLARPAPQLPMSAHPRARGTRLPWTLDPALTGWEDLFALALAGRRAHRQRWDEQVLPYLDAQLNRAWPDAARYLPAHLCRDVMAPRRGFSSPALRLVRSLNLHEHGLRLAGAALATDALSHITHISAPAAPRQHAWSNERPALTATMGSWRLPALHTLELLDARISISQLTAGLAAADLPALRRLHLGGDLTHGAAHAQATQWDALLALPIFNQLTALSVSPASQHAGATPLATASWLALIKRIPSINQVDLRWAQLTGPQLRNLLNALSARELDALDLVCAASAGLGEQTALPAPRALALRAVKLPALLDTALFSRVEELELWPADAARDLKRLARHPRWPHLTHLSLDLNADPIRLLSAIEPPPALRTLRVAWRMRGYMTSAQQRAIAAWSGLTLAPGITRPRAALLSRAAPLLADHDAA